jgi:carotenoid cleavage dioxygenase-like enzyme
MYAFFFSYLFASVPFRKLSPLYLERNSINGFYGMIGPNIERKNTKSLLDLFMGNGVIQGIFINNGTMTYIKREVETEKRRLEKSIFKKPSLLPNPFGVANTALFHHRNLTYALFERDLPYLIDIL